jgi:hypothetical protein
MSMTGSDERFSMTCDLERLGSYSRLVGALGLALLCSGCVALAGDRLPDIEPRPLGIPPLSIEQTVGDFSFHLDGGKMITSNKAGRNVNKMILDRWQRRGLIAKELYVESSTFTGTAEYNLTLAGHQEGDSSVALQVLSGLTLYLIPYSVNTKFDLVYTLEHVESGRNFEARAADSYRTVTQLLLFPITPFALGGAMRTYNRLADHIYEQLAEQGAFDPATWTDNVASTPAPSSDGPSALERLRALDQLREDGLVSSDEYEEKKREILSDL